MLVLSRQRNESIVLGDGLEIVVLEVRGDRVRIGVRTHADSPARSRVIRQIVHTANSSPSFVSSLSELDIMDAYFG